MAQDVKEYQKAYQKARYAKIKSDPIAYRALLDRQTEVRNSDKDRYNGYARNHYAKNRGKILSRLKDDDKVAWRRSYEKTDKVKQRKKIARSTPEAKILASCRKRLWKITSGIHFGESTMELCGTSVSGLKIHLESLWRDGMNWNNYGPFGWHVDHKIPCASFDVTKIEELRMCFHYTNLQPLWWYENLSKGSKITT